MNKNFTSRTTGKTSHGISGTRKFVTLGLLVLCIQTFLPWFFMFIPAGIPFLFWQPGFSNNRLNRSIQAIPVYTRSIPAPAAGQKA